MGCGQCMEACQFQALAVRDKHCFVDTDRCMGCGVCAGACAKSALSLVRAPEKGTPLEIRKLLESA